MQSELPSIKDRRLLLVDDDAALLRSLRRHFERQGWRVYPANGVHDAMRVLSRFKPEVALVDVCMPDGGVMGFFSQLETQNLAIPTVLMSGAPNVRNVIERKLAGTVRFVDKPLDFEATREELAKALATPKKIQSKAQRKAQDLAERIEELLAIGERTNTELPVLDPTLAAALPIFQMESTRTDVIVKVLGRDAATTAAVIRTANSGFFKGSRAIFTLEDSCVRIGMQGVAAVVHEVAVVRAFEIHSAKLSVIGKRLWENANATARLAKEFAKISRDVVQSGSEIYIMALLHNVGEAAALFILDSKLEADEKRVITAEALAPFVATHHENIGASVFRKWALPAGFVSIAGRHHSEDADTDVVNRVIRCAHEITSRTRFPYAFGGDFSSMSLNVADDTTTPEEIERLDESAKELKSYADTLNVGVKELREAIDIAF